MTVSESNADATSGALPWSWHPNLPIENAPIFVWPPRPFAVLKHFLGRGFVLSPSIIYVGLAVAAWY
jgi:Delta7-sterol 5-desaturase